MLRLCYFRDFAFIGGAFPCSGITGCGSGFSFMRVRSGDYRYCQHCHKQEDFVCMCTSNACVFKE